MPDDNVIDLKKQRLQRAWARAEAQGCSCGVVHVGNDDMCIMRIVMPKRPAPEVAAFVIGRMEEAAPLELR